MFNKDILLIDLEATGLNPAKHEIIQLAGALLDKKTLAIKKTFSTYIAPRKWQNRDPEAMKVNKISKAQLAGAPALKKALASFNRVFPKNVIFAYYGGPLDADILRAAYKKSGLVFPFDYHFFNIWGLFYTYFAVKNKLGNKKKFTGFTLEDAMVHFKIKNENRHDALADVLIEAEILRMIINEQKLKMSKN